jgi:hypothetical protein
MPSARPGRCTSILVPKCSGIEGGRPYVQGMSDQNSVETQVGAATFECPIHGAVEGFFETSGPLADAYPYPVLCEECDPVQTIVWFEDKHGVAVDAAGAPITGAAG